MTEPSQGGAKAPPVHSHRRGSANGVAKASLRLSLSKIMSAKNDKASSGTEEDRKKEARTEVERKEKSERARNARRRSSLLQMGVANPSIINAATEVLMQEAASQIVEGTPIQRLQQLLTKAKEKGMSAEKLFEHFAPRGETSITPEAFGDALKKLGVEKQTFHQLDSVELEHIVQTFDKDRSGTIELGEFMEFCLSIPSLPWKAEKARRLGNEDPKDELSAAARNVERRRSSMHAIPIGEEIYQGTKFYWRTKETIDIAIHQNTERGLFTISTRAHGLAGYQHPPILVDIAKIPISAGEVASRVESDPVNPNPVGTTTKGGSEAKLEAAKTALQVEYLLARLKVPDGVNHPDGQEAITVGKESEVRGAAGAGDTPSPPTKPQTVAASPALSPERSRAIERAAHRPFLQKLSTDVWDTLLHTGNIVLEAPYRFERVRKRSSLAEFRRASADFDKLAKETGKLSLDAEGQASKLDHMVDSVSGQGEKHHNDHGPEDQQGPPL